MTCKECDKLTYIRKGAFYHQGTYYNWKHAIIKIIACNKHGKEIREILNKAQDIGKRGAVAQG